LIADQDGDHVLVAVDDRVGDIHDVLWIGVALLTLAP